MGATDGFDASTALLGGVALVLGSASTLVSISFLDRFAPITVLVGMAAATVSFWGFRAIAPRDHWADLSPTTAAVVESASIGLACVAAGVTIHYLSAPVWSLVTGEAVSFPEVLATWDAHWYKSIVEHGYDEQAVQEGALIGQANWAFFPLYPLVVRGVTGLTGWGAFEAGTWTSVALLAVACGFAYRYLVLTRSRSVAVLGAGLLAIGPYAFYNYTLYSEALFICLTAVGFWALETRRHGIAAVAGGLMSATRGVGVFFGLAMVLHLALRTDAFEPLRSAWPPGGEGDLLRGLGDTLGDRRVLLLALIPVGLFAFMLHLWMHVGDPLAFVTVQDAWGRSPENPLTRLWDGITGPYFSAEYMAGVGILGLALAADLVRRGRPIEGTFGIVLLLVPIASGLNSVPRYAFGTTVVVFAIADWLDRSDVGRTIGFGLLTAANMLLLTLWLNSHKLVQ